MTRYRWLMAVAIAALSAACENDLGACDIEAATSPIYFDEGGFPAYPGQALVEVSCGAARFCHAQGIAPEDRFAAPSGVDLDVGVAVSPEDVDRLRHARRVAWNLRHDIFAQVESGAMPPPPPAGDTALSAAARYRALVGTPDEHALPSIDSPEGLEMLGNWLACGAHVVEATEGESQGVGDIVPRGADASCRDGQAACEDLCIDVTSDSANCGGCGVTCGDAQACIGGVCTCLNGLEACGPSCVDVRTDVSNCGMCGSSCGMRFCAGSTCVDSCPADTTDCGGSCVDLMTNLANCGGCGAACRAGEACESGTCSCASGFTLCSAGCVDLDTSPDHCGACGAMCEPGAECRSGACSCPGTTMLCGGACIDASTDPDNCGACGNACGPDEGCARGSCVSCGPAVRFAADVEPIFVARCTLSGCHTGARPAASLRLTAGRAYSELVGPIASCGGNPLVAPGEVEGSYLWSKLTGVGICSGTEMPKRGELLEAAELDIIRSWICRGAAND